MKWLSRYPQETQALWCNVIKNKYGELDNWVTKEVTIPYGASLWRSIRLFCPFLKIQSTIKNFQGLQRGEERRGEDCLWWNGHSKGIYKVKEGYKLTNQPRARIIKWPWKHICIRPLCGIDVETVRHIFLHCKVTDQLWQIFLNLKGISWIMPSKIDDTLFSWKETGFGARNRHRWRIILACIWCTIWRERNDRYFENRSSNVQEIKL
ncbi:hypothetical protein H5410_052459 [Solanum commersonii]|uniref:Reverse transcriptase zinc-binding domain-containing protein n=1 Tax=Solanum commersonii TaxID=4109 RepID=A0A9J5X459_SOLCO|nr:hypothetical protein H5410_052459 [Solanum commersonii]